MISPGEPAGWSAHCGKSAGCPSRSVDVRDGVAECVGLSNTHATMKGSLPSEAVWHRLPARHWNERKPTLSGLRGGSVRGDSTSGGGDCVSPLRTSDGAAEAIRSGGLAGAGSAAAAPAQRLADRDCRGQPGASRALPSPGLAIPPRQACFLRRWHRFRPGHVPVACSGGLP